ncbi:MAG: hypothetical protein GQ532_09625, partial [Methylomarinum sp.]|nr:hypothetical protein [Methylomarinum sp.]
MTKHTNEHDPYFIPLDENEPVELITPTTQLQDNIDTAELLKNIALPAASNKYLKPLLIALLTLFIAIVTWEAIRFFQAIFSWNTLAGIVLTALSLALLVVAIMASVTTWRNNQQIRLVLRLRIDAERYVKEKTFGHAAEFIDDLKALYQDKPQLLLLNQVTKQLPDYSNDAEVITHLSRM